MRFHHALLVSLCVLALPAGAAVVVSFPGAESYTDIGPPGYEREAALDAIKRHLERLGERYLSPQQTLRIEVLDIDLAGRVQYGRYPYPVRIVNDTADWPVIHLRYTLESGGQVVDSREETLSDPTYLQLKGRFNTEGSLYYEKRMLDEWFKSRFAQRSTRR